jgi:hypothetical protein
VTTSARGSGEIRCAQLPALAATGTATAATGRPAAQPIESVTFSNNGVVVKSSTGRKLHLNVSGQLFDARAADAPNPKYAGYLSIALRSGKQVGVGEEHTWGFYSLPASSIVFNSAKHTLTVKVSKKLVGYGKIALTFVKKTGKTYDCSQANGGGSTSVLNGVLKGSLLFKSHTKWGNVSAKKLGKADTTVDHGYSSCIPNGGNEFTPCITKKFFDIPQQGFGGLDSGVSGSWTRKGATASAFLFHAVKHKKNVFQGDFMTASLPKPTLTTKGKSAKLLVTGANDVTGAALLSAPNFSKDTSSCGKHDSGKQHYKIWGNDYKHPGVAKSPATKGGKRLAFHFDAIKAFTISKKSKFADFGMFSK